MFYVCTVCEPELRAKWAEQFSWASPPPSLILFMMNPSTHQHSDVGGFGEGGQWESPPVFGIFASIT